MKQLLTHVWRMLSGNIQWWLLWLTHAKFNIGVSGVLSDGHGRILLLRHVFRRTYDWGLPSGWAKRNETALQALSREVNEEIGLDCSVGEILKIETGFKYRIEIILTGTITNPNDEMRISTEIYEAAFFTLDKLPDTLLPKHREYINSVGILPKS